MGLSNDDPDKEKEKEDACDSLDYEELFRELNIFRYVSSRFQREIEKPEFSDKVDVDSHEARAGRPFVARMYEVLEYYQRGAEDFHLSAKTDHSFRRKELDHGVTLVIGDRGFSLVKEDAQGTDLLVKRVIFREYPEVVTDRAQRYAGDILPNALLQSGPSDYLLSIYEPMIHATHIYGMKLCESKVQLEFLYRVKHFEEELASPPFIVPGGPTSVFQDSMGYVHSYWYLEESNDVEKIFQSEEPLKGDLKDPFIDTDGNLCFQCGDRSYSHAVFYEEYWQEHLQRVNSAKGNG